MAFFNLTQLGAQDHFKPATGRLPGIEAFASTGTRAYTQQEQKEYSSPVIGAQETKSQDDSSPVLGAQETKSQDDSSPVLGAQETKSQDDSSPVIKAQETKSQDDCSPVLGAQETKSQAGTTVDKPLSPRLLSHVEEMYCLTPEGVSTVDRSPQNRSYSEFADKRYKHQRSQDGPNQLYRWPVATSHDYGHWMSLEGADTSWTQHQSHGYVNSEMTRFVDDMNSTNREFSLF